jgi:cell filamentation protein
MLMGLQAGLPALDFGGIRGAKKRRYIAAVHSALDQKYAPMTEIFRDVIARTLSLPVYCASRFAALEDRFFGACF